MEEKEKLLKHFIDHDSDYSFELKKNPDISYSTIMLTRNRSPFNQDKLDLNPLLWAAKSALNQKILPKEFILINDQSDQPPIDYTDLVVTEIGKICQQKEIKFVYQLNKTRQNAAISRNIGAKSAQNNILYFVDDDGILRPDCSYGIYLFSLLKKNDPKCFILNLPQNTRTSHPWILVDKNDVGKINEETLEITSSLITRYPKQYFANPPKIKLDNQEFFEPLLMENFQGGNVIADKEFLLKLGGFPDYGSEISYGEETGLALRAIKNDYKIYYFPYNNLAGMHLSYGNPGGLQQFYGLDWLENEKINLKKMVKESIVPRYGSGMRVEKEYYFYIKIRNFAILLEQYKKGLAEVWMKRSYNLFVQKNEKYFLDNKGIIEKKSMRNLIWQLAKAAINSECLSREKFMSKIKQEG